MTSNRRGSAVVEMAILLPVYLLIVLGLLYLGNLVIIKQRMAMTLPYVASEPGVQSAAGADGNMDLQIARPTSSYVGFLRLDDERMKDRVYPPEEISYLIEEIKVGQAEGHYEVVDGELEWVVETYSVYEQLVDELLGTEEDIMTMMVADSLDDWTERATTTMEYEYDPDFIHIGAVELEGVTQTSTFEVMGRGDKVRTLERDSGSDMDRFVGDFSGQQGTGDLPQFSSTEGFWIPQ